jgi:hypothetical protein
MVSERQWVIINASLLGIVLLLTLNLFHVNVPSLGQAIISGNDPACAVESNGEVSLWPDLDRCCLQATQQLVCGSEKMGDFTKVCSSTDEMKFWLNNDAYSYCTQQPYWSR